MLRTECASRHKAYSLERANASQLNSKPGQRSRTNPTLVFAAFFASKCRFLFDASIDLIRKMFRNVVPAAKKVFQLQPPNEQRLFSLTTERELAAWDHYSDIKYGGLSTSNFALSSESKGAFWGDLSLELDQDKTVHIKKSGFAGLNTKRGFGTFDLAPFDVIEMHLKGDGRTYISSLRTENWVDRATADDNSWHHVIDTTNGEWKVHKLCIYDYRRTWHGRVLEQHVEINPSRVVGMGFHVTARSTTGSNQGPGPFRLELDWIRAVRTKNFHRDF